MVWGAQGRWRGAGSYCPGDVALTADAACRGEWQYRVAASQRRCHCFPSPIRVGVQGHRRARRGMDPDPGFLSRLMSGTHLSVLTTWLSAALPQGPSAHCGQSPWLCWRVPPHVP